MTCKDCERRREHILNMAKAAKQSWENLIGKQRKLDAEVNSSKQPAIRAKRTKPKASIADDGNHGTTEQSDNGIAGPSAE